jgi:UDP-4-amino-4,6-dideoxy-N-acetyl-beta-L-altrosamine transaminase
MSEALAIDGGRPVRSSVLPYGRQSVDESDIRAVVDVLRSDWLTTGPKVIEFEESFASYVGARYAVAVSSGTAALHAAAFACGLKAGDEAITSPLTFAASGNCVLYQQARPVFADVRSDTLNLDPDQVRAKITRRTKALIPVDYTGQPADMDEMNAIAEEHGLMVVEDAAHAPGAKYKGRRVGSLAAMTVFSTHPVKHVTTGEGGVVTTDDPELARQLRMFRNHGLNSDARERQQKGVWFYEMVALGYNYRLTDIQCALGLSQLKKVDGWLERRRAVAARYVEVLRLVPEIELPAVRSDCEPAWHLFVVLLNLERLRVGRAEVFRALRAENIGVNVHYVPVPWHPYYRDLGYQPGHWPVAEAAYERMLSLPIFPTMSDDDVDDVVEALDKVINAYRR